MDEEVLLMIEDCFKRESRLNPWEVNFIQSICDQSEKVLSNKQIEKLESIWERVTS